MEILIEIVLWVILIGGIIYYAVKRFEDEKKEDFEDREN
jgi:hypothetical protein